MASARQSSNDQLNSPEEGPSVEYTMQRRSSGSRPRITQILPSPDFPLPRLQAEEQEKGFGGLFLGSISLVMCSPQDRILQATGIKAVVSVVSEKGDELVHAVANEGVLPEDHYFFPLEDTTGVGQKSNSKVLRQSSDHLAVSVGGGSGIDSRSAPFIEASEFIESRRREGKNVLVHCDMGIMRSPSVIVAHLIVQYHLDYLSATDFVKKVAPKSQFRLFTSPLKTLCLLVHGGLDPELSPSHSAMNFSQFSPSMSPVQLMLRGIGGGENLTSPASSTRHSPGTRVQRSGSGQTAPGSSSSGEANPLSFSLSAGLGYAPPVNNPLTSGLERFPLILQSSLSINEAPAAGSYEDSLLSEQQVQNSLFMEVTDPNSPLWVATASNGGNLALAAFAAGISPNTAQPPRSIRRKTVPYGQPGEGEATIYNAPGAAPPVALSQPTPINVELNLPDFARGAQKSVSPPGIGGTHLAPAGVPCKVGVSRSPEASRLGLSQTLTPPSTSLTAQDLVQE